MPPAKHRAERAPKTFKMPSVPMPTVSLPAAFSAPQAKRVFVASGIAVAATGVAVTTGVAGSAASTGQFVAADSPNASTASAAAGIVADRTVDASRSLDRTALASTTKAAALSSSRGAAVTQSADLTKAAVVGSPGVNITPGSAKAITIALMPSFGMSPSDFSCIDQIWTQESGWNVHAANASGAYGIPQALPGSKMASAGPDWQNNATTQIKWGLGYIQSRYGSPCNAAAFKLSHGWY